EIAQIRNLLLQRSAALEANHDGNLSLALGAVDICGRAREDEMRGFCDLGMRMIEGAHEALQVACRQPRCRKIPVSGIATNVIADHRHSARAESGQMPAVQHSAFSALASPVDIGGDDVAVTDDDDSLFVQIGCFVRHRWGLLRDGPTCWIVLTPAKTTISSLTVSETANTSRSP